MSNRACRVIIVLIETNPYHRMLTNLLLDCLDSCPQGWYSPGICNTNGTREDIHTKISKAIDDDDECDIFIVLGETCNIYTQEIVDKKGGHPTIFIDVQNPIQSGLIHSYEKPKGYATGVIIESSSPKEMVTNLALFKEHLHRLIIPYSPTTRENWFSRAGETIQALLRDENIIAIPTPIEEKQASLVHALTTQRASTDGILFLEGCYSNKFTAEVAYYCWENSMLFCGSTKDSLAYGAACAFGGDEGRSAIAAFTLLRQYWEEKKPLGSIPVTILPNTHEFTVNSNILRQISIPESVITNLEQNTKAKVICSWINSPL